MNKEKYLPSTLKNDENFSVKELAKTLCTCHHKCNDTTDCVVEDEALLLINENKSNNFDVKSNNEIDEIAKLICAYPQCIYYNIIGECANKECHTVDFANRLYNAGYRKQREGEWVKHGYKWQCTKCKVLMDIDGTPKENLLNYCPNCGVKMKGGEE